MSLKKSLVVVSPLGVLGVVLALAPMAFSSGNATCSNQTWTTNVSGNLTVPSNKFCTISGNVTIGGSVIVQSGATLTDKGANIRAGINASSPKGIGIGGNGTSAGNVAASINISGTSGQGPGTVITGSNYICNTNVGQSVSVSGSLGTAGPWIIGDRDEDCSNGANQVGQSVSVQNNQDRVDISDQEKGTYPYMVGIDQSLAVTGNKVTTTSPVVESNFIGQNATCQAGTKMDGDGTHNIVEQSNSGCP